MKNRVKTRVLAAVLSLVMLFSLVGVVYAADEEVSSETVYVMLDATGAKREIIVKNGGAEEKNVDGILPYNIKLSYSLNGTQSEPRDILGKSGDIKILVDISPNPDSKAYYREKLALQMQLPIDMGDDIVTDLNPGGLSGVTVGTIKTLSAVVLPSKSAKYEISYKTKAFALQSINFVCMPFDLAGMANINISSITSQISQLQNGISQYVDGVGQSSDGLSKINSGINNIASNSAPLMDAYKNLSSGEIDLMNAMLSTMTPQLQSVFAPKIQAIQEGQKQIVTSLTSYMGGVSQIAASIAQLAAGSATLVKSGTALKNGVNSAIAPMSEFPDPSKSNTTPVSFISENKVSEIQFVMKTDSLSSVKTKEDVLPAKKSSDTFFDRLLALFGL